MQVLLILVFVGVLVFFISKSIAAKQTEQSRVESKDSSNHSDSCEEQVESITIPDGTTEIKNGEFRNFRKLKSITIPNSVTSIGESAFEDCSSLTNITIPNSVTSIGESAFEGCSSLKSFNGKFASEDGRCLIKDGELIAFAPAGLTSYTIPNSVKSIGDSAFRYCRSLTSIAIPNSVTEIGGDAFGGCSSLKSITIGNSVTSIGVEAFYNCSSLTSITIPDSVTEIGGGAFHGCSSLTSITIGNGVKSIGNFAFRNCSSLTNIAIPDSLIKMEDGEFKKIGYGIFNGCTNLKSFNDNFASKKGRLLFISEDGRCLIAIGGDLIAFAPAGLTEYTIPDGIARIKQYAFYGCKELTNIVIPNSVYDIGFDAFKECSRLKSFSGDLASKDGRCIIKNGELLAFIPLGLTRYTIPDSVTHIEMSVFKFCDCLTDITIPEGVKRIGREAFSDCKNLKSITIPTSVEKIGAFAFYGCSSLTSINIPKGTNVHGDAFAGCPLDAEITKY